MFKVYSLPLESAKEKFDGGLEQHLKLYTWVLCWAVIYDSMRWLQP